MTKLEDPRIIIRSVHHAAQTANPQPAVVAAVRGLYTAARWDTFNPEHIDVATIRVNRTREGIEATARYGRLHDDCETCHQPPGRPHTDYCQHSGRVVAP